MSCETTGMDMTMRERPDQRAVTLWDCERLGMLVIDHDVQCGLAFALGIYRGLSVC